MRRRTYCRTIRSGAIFAKVSSSSRSSIAFSSRAFPAVKTWLGKPFCTSFGVGQSVSCGTGGSGQALTGRPGCQCSVVVPGKIFDLIEGPLGRSSQFLGRDEGAYANDRYSSLCGALHRRRGAVHLWLKSRPIGTAADPLMLPRSFPP